MAGSLITLVIAGGFYAVGYAIASRWRKPLGVTVVYAVLIGLGLACVCVALLFGACMCAMGNSHL